MQKKDKKTNKLSTESSEIVDNSVENEEEKSKSRAGRREKRDSRTQKKSFLK